MSKAEDILEPDLPAARAESEAAPFSNAPPPVASGQAGGSTSTDEPWVGDVWLDGTPYDPNQPDPFEETRLPEDEGPPYPPGLCDPLSPDLLDTARYLLRFVLRTFWSSPRWLMWVGEVWQWRKFEFLDWLRPLELLLRRMVMIEALSLLASQALPRRKPMTEPAGTGEPAVAASRLKRPAAVYDPDHPERWNVSFTVIPPVPRYGRRCRSPNPAIKRYWRERDLVGFKKTALRYRRVLHPALPLAKRLEAVIRVIADPAPFARRAAFRLRARASLGADLLLTEPSRPALRLATDALRWARDRLGQLYAPVWEQYWSSA